MANSSLTSHSPCTPRGQVQGITEIRQKTIAALIARGFSVKYVAKKLKISEDRIYHLCSEKNSLVNAEINRFLNEAFAASDRRLINLYDKALQKLDAMLSSSNAETQCRAIDRIIRIYLTRSAKNAVTIQQYFGIQSQEKKDGKMETVDEVIIRKAKERELAKKPYHKNGPYSSSDDSSPNNSPTNTPPPSTPSSNVSPEMKAFLEEINKPPREPEPGCQDP
jgi:DNA-binding CsgD family transcriptional regulator